MRFTLSKTLRNEIRQVIDETATETNVVVNGHQWTRICKRVEVYACRELGLLVKLPNFILRPDTPKKVRVPTIRVGDDWVVQPIVERKNLKEAVKLIRAQLNPNIVYDLHEGNVGWYQGKPVMFDW